jgi:tetratricopeptide (TPR) repeat protein
MKRLIAVIVVVGALTGCQSNTSKQDAHKQWFRARGQVLCELGNEHFKAGQLDDARGKALEALKLNDELDEARLLLGKVYLEQDRYLEAVNPLAAVTVHQPNLAEGWYLLAVAQERSDQPEQALASYTRACELDAANTDAILARGEVLVALGRIADARQAAESAFTAHRTDPGLYEQAGRLAMMQEDYKAAAAYFQQAGDLDCRNLRYQESQALALLLGGQYQRAAGILEQITRSADYRPSAWVHSTLGDCYLAMGRPDEAQDAYGRACDLDNRNPRSWCNAARASMEAGDFRRAAIAAGEALRLESYHRDASMLYGYALLREGQVEQALTFLRQACRAHPDSSDLHCLLGRAYEARGDPGAARRCYDQAAQMEPANALARQLLASADGARTVR